MNEDWLLTDDDIDIVKNSNYPTTSDNHKPANMVYVAMCRRQNHKTMENVMEWGTVLCRNTAHRITPNPFYWHAIERFGCPECWRELMEARE